MTQFRPNVSTSKSRHFCLFSRSVQNIQRAKIQSTLLLSVLNLRKRNIMAESEAKSTVTSDICDDCKKEGTVRPASAGMNVFESGFGAMVSLEIAAAEGHVKCLEALLNAGADVKYANCDNGYTPLMWAARNGKDECVEVLIKAGADVNIGDSHNENALMHASSYLQNIKCIKLLLEAGADVNHSDRHGATALMHAACASHVDIVTLLIKAGADVNSVTKESLGSITAVKWSATSLHGWKCIDTLAKSGADVNVISDGKTPLMLAVQEGERCEKSVEALIKAGADVNIVDEKHGFTVLHQAVQIGSGFCTMLIEAGADVNVKGLGGCTPLMDAMDDRKYNCAEALIKAGADVNFTCDQGNTALFWAAERDCSSWTKTAECVKLLLRSGARINVRNNRGYNAVENTLSTANGMVGETFLTLMAAGETVNQVIYPVFLSQGQDSRSQLKVMGMKMI